MIVLAVIVVVFGITGITGLALWDWRSRRDIDYTPTHEPNEQLRSAARAVNTATIGFMTGPQ